MSLGGPLAQEPKKSAPAGSEPSGGRPVYLHIGLQKTGTSYLQSIFWQSQPELTRQGLDMVPGSKRDTFHLMLRVRGRFNPEIDPPEVEQALDLLPDLLTQARGSRSLISEESLAPASHDQIAALVAACTGREVHLVLTARDLGRQIPSAWQQVLQSGGSMSFDGYLRRLKRNIAKPRSKYWANKNLNEILDRWSRHIPEDRIHIVTVPPPGNPPEVLLRRFCEVLGVDPALLDRQVARRNESVGRAQAEVLSRVNGLLSKADRRRDVYGDVGKRYFAVKVLVPQQGDRIVVPARHQRWVREVSATFVDRIAAGGFQVIGDLADLNPPEEVFTRGTGEPTPEEVLEAATRAIAQMLGERMEKQRAREAKAAWKRRVRTARHWLKPRR
jgi:hypothetical protein